MRRCGNWLMVERASANRQHTAGLSVITHRPYVSMKSVRMLRRAIRTGVALGIVLYLTAWAARIYTRKYYVWLPAYWSWMRSTEPAGPTVHLFFLYVDHFEPGAD